MVNKALVVAVVILAGLVLILSGRRYTITPMTREAAYQMDQLTGRTWYLIGDVRVPVGRLQDTVMGRKSPAPAPVYSDLPEGMVPETDQK